MTKKEISGGVAHELPADLREALTSSKKALEKWESLTPLARNEWICWNITVKQQDTRTKHIERTIAELQEGKRRPCCWLGCVHRKDKPISASQKWVLEKQAKKKS
jgi:uncharacterized protein YdeI (YjbR/CyaY-like superfamily)